MHQISPDLAMHIKTKLFRYSFGLLLLVSFVNGCAPSVYYVQPKEWSTTSSTDSVINSYRPYLLGRRIFLDPGHGGEDRANRGPAGKAIEADVNLQVGLELREFLQKAGAVVFLSRAKDSTVTLQDRPVLALQSGAEIFVSIHHNATPLEDAVTNYTATYYHAHEGDPAFHPSNHDLARYIQRDNAYAMRNPSPPFSPTFDGTLSDFGIYPNSGFAVLRHNTLPAVLIEGSFFTHPHEESRLALQEFKRIEAWGIFLGLGKYFRSGIPRLVLASDSIIGNTTEKVLIKVESPGKIDSTSLVATLDGKQIPATFDGNSRSISISLREDIPGGAHTLSVWVRNQQGTSSWPFRKKLLVRLPPASILLSAHPNRLPLLGEAFARVRCRILDERGSPVADGISVRFTIDDGSFDSTMFTKGGTVSFYVRGTTNRKPRTLSARTGNISTTFPLQYSTEHKTFLTGIVRSSSDSMQIDGAIIFQRPSTQDATTTQVLDTSWSDGRFIVYNNLPDPLSLHVSRTGFFTSTAVVRHASEPVRRDFLLNPIAGGRLIGKTYLIDPRYGGRETGVVATTGLRSSDVNLEIGNRLHELLTVAGANAILIRYSDSTITESDRARVSISYKRGMYIRLDASGRDRQASAQIYRSIPNTKFAAALLAGLRIAAGFDSAGITGSQEKLFYEVAMGTISIALPSVTTGRYDRSLERSVDEIAWGLFLGILQSEGYAPSSIDVYEVRDRQNGRPIAGARVRLNETLDAISNDEGLVQFFGLGGGREDVRAFSTDAETIRKRL